MFMILLYVDNQKQRKWSCCWFQMCRKESDVQFDFSGHVFWVNMLV